ncbi:hypothetical protein L915_08349 [Phytophthora nicotianae]|uniref:Uncharacterized protein n=1 Tax=Phytophthora nicotianae TaxID=4792 RepID=W2GXY0_PHYNI|nr:hypothetical protein L915_08349 [Phytophthora nicotianae]ETL40591.1 hypothetical protein L916_08274 [Phytophthora nicotianae]
MWYEISNKIIAKEIVAAKERGVEVNICLSKAMLDHTAASKIYYWFTACKNETKTISCGDGKMLSFSLALVPAVV